MSVPWRDVLARLDVRAFYGSEGIDLPASGKTKCPFHDDQHASFSVNKEGRYKCFACGVNGSAFDLWISRHHGTFAEALRAVAQFAPGVAIDTPQPKAVAVVTPAFDKELTKTWHQKLLVNPEMLSYLAGRGISRESVILWGLGWTGERISIPIHDHTGDLVNAKLYKVGGGTGDKMLWATRGTPAPLFVPPSMMQTDVPVVLVEGEFDCIVAWQNGINAQTGTAGAGTWKKEWSEYFKGRKVVVLYDHDTAGLEGAARAATALTAVGATVEIALWPDEAASGYDVTDWFARDLRTASELGALLDRARSYSPERSERRLTNGAVFVSLGDVTPQTVDWLWEGRIPLGKLSLLIGDPGVGKSTISLDIAARVTRGGRWPDGGSAPHSNVILLTAEDDLADTVKPRLLKLGADCDRVTAITAIQTGDKERWFSLEDDLEALEEHLLRTNADLVIIDPLTAYMGRKIDSHVDTDVRTILAPLARIAAIHGVAVVAVMHMNKSTDIKSLYRVIGSVAFAATARAVFAVAEDPEDPERKFFMPVKMNLAPHPSTLAFELNGTVKWDPDPVSGADIEEALSARPRGKKDTAVQEAIEFLRQELEGGPVASLEVLKHAKDNGISPRTLDRAKAKMSGIRSKKVGEIWYMEMEKKEDRHQPRHGFLDVLGGDGDVEGQERQERQERQDTQGGLDGGLDGGDDPPPWYSDD